MVNVLIDCRPVRKPLSGVARYCMDLSHALDVKDRDDLQFSFYTQNFLGRNKDLNELKRTVKKISESFCLPRKVENLFLEFGGDLRFLRPYLKPDVIHETYFGRLESRGAVKISTIQDVIPIDFPHFFSKRNVYFSQKNLERQATKSDLVVVTSEYTKQRVLDLYPGVDNITVVPIGVSSSLEEFAAKSESNWSSDSDYVVVVGNIEPRKNIQTAVDAVHLYNKRHNAKLKLIVIGKENFESKDIIEYSKNKLGDDVVFTGFVSTQKKFELISNSLSLIFPSSYEGFGIPAIEGMALGVPTLLANNSSLKELAHDKWQLFGTFEPEELCTKLEDISGGRVPIDVVGLQKTTLSKYNWTSVSEQMVDIYRSFL